MPDIKLEGVSKFYKNDRRQFAAVEEINLTIQQGEFVFITGSSGAGKTTLLQLIAGEIPPSQGKIYLGKKRIDQRRKEDRVRANFGKVTQIPQLMRKRTIAQNLEAVARAKRGVRGGSAQKRIQKALRMVGLAEVQEKYPVDLSGGECRLVELARAIINSPPILVLDELTANLDEDTIWDILHLLNELNRQGTTVIMATHAKQFVNLMRKRVITLVDGRVLGDVQNGRYGALHSSSSPARGRRVFTDRKEWGNGMGKMRGHS